jgi:hypothetical protein
MSLSTREQLALVDSATPAGDLLVVLDRHGDLAQVVYHDARVQPDDCISSAWLVLQATPKRHAWRSVGSNSYGYVLDYQACTECSLTSEEEERPCGPDVNVLLDYVWARARTTHDAVDSGLAGVTCRCGKLCNSWTHHAEHATGAETPIHPLCNPEAGECGGCDAHTFRLGGCACRACHGPLATVMA